MTQTEIATKVLKNLEDEGSIHFTSEDTRDSIQDGYDLIALETGCVERVTTVSWVANQVYYNFSSLISDYYRVFSIYNQRTEKWMEPLTWRELREATPKWQLMHGEAISWAPLGYSHIALYRTPSVSDSETPMLVLYSAQANTLGADDVPEIPIDLQDTLVDYSTGDLLDQDLEYEKSMKYFASFNTKMERIKKWMQQRSLPDRIYGLLALNSAMATRSTR